MEEEEERELRFFEVRRPDPMTPDSNAIIKVSSMLNYF